MHLSQTFSFKRTERACEEGSGGVRGARGGAGQDQRVAQHQQVSLTLPPTFILGTTMISIEIGIEKVF